MNMDVGRFDREVEMGVPDCEGRLQILHIHTRKMRLDASVRLDEVGDVIDSVVYTDNVVSCDLLSVSKLL